ncbi:nucleotidyl transferase AbiEii/AbiGii toxin family protein [Streptomyces sp. CA-111067]|uniref:nucleotidyl transferase AbiEii/AbiGii toxin family protein n=1 Tax=Streptomyces sp. CA-111067 TaxID=3240046 RepID=UPI003D991A80
MTDPREEDSRADSGGDSWPEQPFPRRRWDAEQPEAELARRERELPRTLMDVTENGTQRAPGTQEPGAVRQQAVFDPALLHFSRAFRVGEPRFDDPATADRWRATRRQALDAVLTAIAGSAWAGSLVLRGSALLAGWFGPAAREPRDLDFVVVPADWRIEEARTGRMLQEVAAASQQAAATRDGGPALLAGQARSEYIWAYERVPGRRMVLPWTAAGLPGGVVQLDFVFGEELPVAPVRSRVRLAEDESPGAELLTATPELSLAWKLLWLVTDMHPQGKDLYDAVLLAERFPLRYDLLNVVLSREEPVRSRGHVTFHDIEQAADPFEWEHFHQEYPHLADDQRRYADRLVDALRPVFPPAPGTS